MSYGNVAGMNLIDMLGVADIHVGDHGGRHLVE